MEIGIHGGIEPGDEDLISELGVTWTKWGVSLQGDETPDERPRLERCRDLGLRVVLDLRTDCAALNKWAVAGMENLRIAGQLDKAEPGASLEEQTAIIQRNQKRAHGHVHREVADRVARFVEKHGDLCEDWEWWGEWACPHTSQGLFHIVAYPQLLAAMYDAVKSVQPQARVWTGGNGMDLHSDWALAIMQDGCGDKFDVCNWHPYFMANRDLSLCKPAMEQSFREVRGLLQSRGKDQPFAATEWGYPSLPVIPQELEVWLESHVIEGGIRQLRAQEAVKFFEQDLQTMEEWGFEVVIVHTLRDAPGRHWGEKCGLLTVDGARKPVFDVVKRWGQRAAGGRRAFAPAPQHNRMMDAALVVKGAEFAGSEAV